MMRSEPSEDPDEAARTCPVCLNTSARTRIAYHDGEDFRFFGRCSECKSAGPQRTTRQEALDGFCGSVEKMHANMDRISNAMIDQSRVTEKQHGVIEKQRALIDAMSEELNDSLEEPGGGAASKSRWAVGFNLLMHTAVAVVVGAFATQSFEHFIGAVTVGALTIALFLRASTMFLDRVGASLLRGLQEASK